MTELDNLFIVKVRGSEIKQLALGFLEINAVRKVRPNDKCWVCKITPNDMEHSMSVGMSNNSINRMFCNPCALVLMEKGIKVIVNKLPIEMMRKYRITDIVEGLQ
jgi:hypothetical protein